MKRHPNFLRDRMQAKRVREFMPTNLWREVYTGLARNNKINPPRYKPPYDAHNARTERKRRK